MRVLPVRYVPPVDVLPDMYPEEPLDVPPDVPDEPDVCEGGEPQDSQ
ncbi:hypothetical protein [Actinomadura sp. NEAU-AAG7]